jgi:osmotically-inducible protein OsmY
MRLAAAGQACEPTDAANQDENDMRTAFDSTPKSAADSLLERRVVDTLTALHIPALRSLHINAQEGVVLLSGRVRSYYEKQLAHTRARNVLGVVAVSDAIVVADQSSPPAADSLQTVPASTPAPGVSATN